PISSDTTTRWNFTYFVLKWLLELQNSVVELVTYLINNPDHTVCANSNNLKERILLDKE
ncbi:16556_t:CDS:1, partial [Cetraspora pellucida]